MTDMTKIEGLVKLFFQRESFHGEVKTCEKLSSRTTMNVGGNAKLFLEPEDSSSLIFAVTSLLEAHVDFFVLGGGSNVVISDSGLDAVISTRKLNEVRLDSPDEKVLKIGCGASWGSVISFCRKNNLGGFEGFTGLSGTCGGALYMNATCFGLSACDNLVSVEYFDLSDMSLHVYEKNDFDWGYKKSPFQGNVSAGDGDFKGRCPLGEGEAESADALGAGGRLSPFIILSAKFRMHDGFDADFSEKCIASRKEKGHFRSPSSGSAFKNDALNGIIAGKVIDECDLKGFSVGGAQIAPWHGNFIINPAREASASDVRNLSERVREIVLEKKGIRLESEIIFVGDFS